MLFRDLRPAHLALAVALVTAALWSTGLAGGYHFDDAVTPLSDPASQSLGAFVEHVPDTLRPVTKLTYAIEGTAGLDDVPVARRAVGVAIHAVAAALLCLLLIALAVPPARAGLFALVWAAHPVHAEAVLAIAGRSAVLSTALAFAALLAYRRDHVRWAAVLLALAALARETALAVVLALAVLELATEAPWRVHARRLVPAALASALVIVWLIATPRVRELADFSFTAHPVGPALARQLAAVPIGLSLYVRTWALSIDHGDVLPTALAWAGVAIYALAILAVVALPRRSPLVGFGAALWLAAILPTQSIIPKLDALTERPLAFALAGIVIAVAAWSNRRVVIVAIPVVIALAIATVARGRMYRSDLLLWADAAEKSVTNVRPVMNHAFYLYREGREDEALRELDRAHDMAPANVQIGELRAALAGGRHAP